MKLDLSYFLVCLDSSYLCSLFVVVVVLYYPVLMQDPDEELGLEIIYGAISYLYRTT